MKVESWILILLYMLMSGAAHTTDSPQLGIIMSDTERQQLDQLDIFPNGTALPKGRGTVESGEKLYQQLCKHCHGEEGIGATAEALADSEGTLTDPYPDKTIGLYWPYASTLFDLIRRAMPLDNPASLSNDDAYALTAYLLAINGLIATSGSLDQTTLPLVVMPNEEGFTSIYPQQ